MGRLAALLSIALACPAQSPEETFVELRRAMGRADFDRAIQLGEAIVDRDPFFSRAWLQMSNAYRQKGNLEAARVHFERLQSRHSQACLGLVYYWSAAKRFDLAQATAASCASRFPAWLPVFRAWADASVDGGSGAALISRLEREPDPSAGVHLAAGLALTLGSQAGDTERQQRAQVHLEEARRLSPDDPEVDDALYYHYIEQKKLAEAEQPLLRLLARASPRGDADWILRAGGRLAGVEAEARRLEPARLRLEQIIPLDREFGLKEGERFHRLWLGITYFELGRFTEALEQLERTLGLATAPIDKVRTHGWIGQVHHAAGGLAQSVMHYRLAAEFAREAGNLPEEVMYSTNLALAAFDLGDVATARTAMTSTRPQLAKITLPFYRAQLLFDHASLERSLGKPAAALALYEESVRLAMEVTKDPSTETRARLLRAELLLDLNRLPEADADLTKASALALETKLGREQCQAALFRGRLFHARKDEPAALLQYQDGLARAVAIGSLPLRAQGHLGLSDVHWKANRLAEALAERQKAIQILEQIRAGLANSSQTATFLAQRLGAYRETAKLELALNRAADAFATSERGRARSLLDLVNSGERSEATAEERQLTATLARTQDEYRTQRGAAAAGERMRHAQDALERYLYSHPEPTADLEQPAGANEVMAGLAPDEVLLHYAMDAGRSGVFAITREQVRYFPLGPGATLEGTARRLRPFLERRPRLMDRVALSAASQAVFAQLIAPAEPALRGKTSLIIVADGLLQSIPFDALQSATGQYLMERFTIRYAPSASALLALERRGRRRRAPSRALLAMADANGGGGGAGGASQLRSGVERWKLGPLPFSRTEVREAARAWVPSPSGVYVGADANESTLKREKLDDFRAIHFAVHGLLDDTQPRFSALALAPADAEDGLLQMHEIRRLRLNANVVILSACESGLGQRVTGEGVVGLAHAFLTAGAQSVLATLWRVDDQSSAQLMGRFHRSLAQQGSAAQALRQAKLGLLRDAATSHPFYWAGFVLTGAGR